MCGISGLATSNFSPEEKKHLIIKMADTLNHRGPDNRGYYIDEYIALGHNRLALLDLQERSNQPFENDRYVLIFNGEIYNFQLLKIQMENNFSVQFHTTSDTEVLFQSLIILGIEKTVTLIKGMFAFAFYDKLEQTVIICRDRIGIKPLFYSTKNGNFIFASEVKAISLSASFDKILPHFLLQAPFGLYEISRKFTAFEDVYQLEPGTYLKYSITNASHEIITYFKTVDWVDQSYWEKLNTFSRNDIDEYFEKLLDNAIHSMILADAPMGAFVSGGIDSSIIATLAQKHRKINLYTANVIGKYSEFSDAEHLAKHLNTNLFSYTFQPEMFLRDWVKATWFYESPIVVHTNAIPFQNVSQMTSANKDKAVVTGEGSDELFLGYPRLLSRRYNSFIKFPITFTNSIYKKIPKLSRYLNLENTNFLGDINKQTLSFEKQILEQSYREAYSFLRKHKSFDDQLLTPRMIDNGLHSLLWRNDRMGMIHSIESRFPFLDEDVMRFGMNLPVKHKIGRTNTVRNWKHPFLIDKAIVRRLGNKYLPQKLANKNKDGFPMYGHMHIKVDKGFFENGFWQNFFHITNEAINFMDKNTNPYLIAKLASVEIWGSLFILKQTIDEVNIRVNKHIRMNIKN